MNRIAYASDLIEDAAGLLIDSSEGVSPKHFNVLRRVISQLSLYREALMMCEGENTWSRSVSEQLAHDVDSMLGHDVATMFSIDLLDEYVSCRLDSTSSVIQRIAGYYLETTDTASVNIGCTIFEAGHWVISAINAVRIETAARMRPSLSIAA
jgi:hypothetical protein